MKYKNIVINGDVEIDPTSMMGLNNVVLSDGVKIAKNCSLFGGPNNPLEIGTDTYVGMNTIMNGYVDKITIGTNVSFGANVYLMVDNGPNASKRLQRLYPVEHGPITIGNHCWVGSESLIMPGITLGDFCIVAANSFVKQSFPAYSIIGGTPAKLIRKMTQEEIDILNKD